MRLVSILNSFYDDIKICVWENGGHILQQFYGSSEPHAVPESEAYTYLSLKGLSISLHLI